MVITYLSSPSKVAKAIAILAQCVTIRLYTPKCSDRCDILKLSLCLWEKNFGGLVRNGVPLQSRLLIVLKPVAPKETLQ